MTNIILGNMRQIAIVFLTAILLAGTNAAVSAQETPQEISPEHLALAREFVDINDENKIYEVTLVQAGIQSMKTIVSQNPEIEEQASTAIGNTIKDYASQKDDLLDQFSRVYALHFSVEELQTLVDFYKTPVGAKLAKEQPTISGELNNVIQVFRSNLGNEFFARVKADLKEQGIDL